MRCPNRIGSFPPCRHVRGTPGQTMSMTACKCSVLDHRCIQSRGSLPLRENPSRVKSPAEARTETIGSLVRIRGRSLHNRFHEKANRVKPSFLSSGPTAVAVSALRFEQPPGFHSHSSGARFVGPVHDEVRGLGCCNLKVDLEGLAIFRSHTDGVVWNRSSFAPVRPLPPRPFRRRPTLPAVRASRSPRAR